MIDLLGEIERLPSPYSLNNPINDIYYINQNTVKHEH